MNQITLQIKKLERFGHENSDLKVENNKLESTCKKLNSELQRMKRTLEVCALCISVSLSETLREGTARRLLILRHGFDSRLEPII